MEQEKQSKKQTKPSDKTRLTLKFQGTGQHEGKSLQELLKLYPKGRIRVREQQKPQENKHPAEDFYRGLRGKMDSLLEGMPEMTSMPFTETETSTRKKQ